MLQNNLGGGASLVGQFLMWKWKCSSIASRDDTRIVFLALQTDLLRQSGDLRKLFPGRTSISVFLPFCFQTNIQPYFTYLSVDTSQTTEGRGGVNSACETNVSFYPIYSGNINHRSIIGTTNLSEVVGYSFEIMVIQMDQVY